MGGCFDFLVLRLARHSTKAQASAISAVLLGSDGLSGVAHCARLEIVLSSWGKEKENKWPRGALGQCLHTRVGTPDVGFDAHLHIRTIGYDCEMIIKPRLQHRPPYLVAETRLRRVVLM